VAVTARSAPVIKIFDGTWSGNSREGPHEAYGREAIVFHVSSAYGDAAPGSPSNWGGTGERLEPSGIGETIAVIANFG
jgi:hypothetical protein